MLKLLKPANPEDLFVQRYDLLMGWALSLTAHNQALAEDLVHDAFIQFTLRRAELGAIENYDAYLHRMLRNMHLSQVRRAGLIQASRFSIANFDSAEMGLRAVDPREDVTVQDELRLICQYACARKETSKAGSVLILRFFHSYYPSEIAKILRTNRTAVDRWLAIARREAKNYLIDPASLRFTTENPPPMTGELGYARTTLELLNELRRTIFESRKSDCLSSEQIKELYRAKTTLDSGALSHLVSCPKCLDTVNRLLGLPLLAERNSDERLGRDKDVPPDSSGGEAGGGGSLVESKRRYERRFKEVIEHRPQELRIAVNGFVLGAQQVSSEINKQALTVNVDEPIGFIEVFSEQGVRLLFLDVDQPTDGNIEQNASAEFDCGRKLELSLNFRGPWPALNVAYRDPTFVGAEELQNITEEDEVLGAGEVESQGSSPTVREGLDRRVHRSWANVRARLRNIRLGTLDTGLLLRPATVTALLAVLVIAAFVAIRLRAPFTSLTAAQLLEQALQQEEILAARTDQVLHRTINLEEKRASGELIARRKIEVWQSAEKGITARRLFDEKGSLIAGDWRRADGVQTLYSHSARPQIKSVPETKGAVAASLNFESAWHFLPSAKDFTSLVGRADNARVEERASDYLISYSRDESGGQADGVLKVALALSRTDLHAIEQTFTLRKGNEVREYRMMEASFERRPPSTVAPSVFEPDAELLNSGLSLKVVPTKNDAKPDLASNPAPLVRVVATPELEVEVLGLLNQIGADLGQEVIVTRIPGKVLKVEAVVDTGKRKREILAALASVATNPAVNIQVETAAEAQQRSLRARSAPGSQTGPSSVTTESVTNNSIPVQAQVRQYLLSRGISEQQIDTEVGRTANQIVIRSHRAMLHVWALKSLIQRFSAEDLRTLDADARGKWLRMIATHAREFQKEAIVLRQELAPIFNAGSLDGSPTQSEIAGDANLIHVLTALIERASSNHEVIRSAFTISTGSNSTSAITTPQFWRSLSQAESIAASIQSATQRLK